MQMLAADSQSDQLDATFVPFTAQTRMSGVNLAGRAIRKGAPDAITNSCARSRTSSDVGIRRVRRRCRR